MQGTPQGIAVYQNGVRINESFGDVVNWDFIPETAIRRLDLVPNNPIFGLNAIGGAISIEMKNGFNYQGAEADVTFGSYGRRSAVVQAGKQDGNLSIYAAFDAINDNGWRQFSSASSLRRMYIDLGARNDTTEFHINFTGADNKLGSVAATPLQMLNQNWAIGLYVAADHPSPAGVPQLKPQRIAHRHADFARQHLLPRFLASACRRQRHRCGALRHGAGDAVHRR